MFGKLIALDSNILGEVVNSDQVSYVKKKCDLSSHKKSGEVKFNQAHEGIQITFHSFCNSVFQLEKQPDEKKVLPLNFKSNFKQIFAETKAFTYKFVPPPKLS
ncbi:hypothetical protein DHD80_19270 [Gramella sp. AN32]|nr:hypothetical protein [Gramella sp. AN32]